MMTQREAERLEANQRIKLNQVEYAYFDRAWNRYIEKCKKRQRWQGDDANFTLWGGAIMHKACWLMALQEIKWEDYEAERAAGLSDDVIGDD